MNESIACVAREGLVLKWCYDCGHYEPAVLGATGWICCSCGRRIQDWVSKLLYGHERHDNGVIAA